MSVLPAGASVGPYRIIQALGSGGAGAVYLVEHTVTGRREALKLLAGAYTEEAAQRFMREIRLQARMSHPHIAAVHNAFIEGDRVAMALEHVQGETLESILEKRRLPPVVGLEFMRQILDALSHAHEQGVVHRDVSPANVIVTSNGSVKITDFGLARGRNDPRLTQMGVAVGSLFYMAPEQVRGVAEVDHLADIYSAGVLLYQILTGVRPFDGGDSFAIMRAHVEQSPTPPSQVEKTPKELDAIVLKALHKEPGQRYQSAAAFRRDVEAVLDSMWDQNAEETRNEPVAAGPPAPPPAPAPAAAATRQSGSKPMDTATDVRTALARRRNRWRKLFTPAIAAIAFALVVGLLAGVRLWRTKPESVAKQTPAPAVTAPPVTSAGLENAPAAAGGETTAPATLAAKPEPAPKPVAQSKPRKIPTAAAGTQERANRRPTVSPLAANKPGPAPEPSLIREAPPAIPGAAAPVAPPASVATAIPPAEPTIAESAENKGNRVTRTLRRLNPFRRRKPEPSSALPPQDVSAPR